jgi:hypothetical protein
MAAPVLVTSGTGSSFGSSSAAAAYTASPAVGTFNVIAVFLVTSTTTAFVNANPTTITVTDNATGGSNTYTRVGGTFNNIIDSNGNFVSGGVAIFTAPVARTNATLSVTVTTTIAAVNIVDIVVVASNWSGTSGLEPTIVYGNPSVFPNGEYYYTGLPPITSTVPNDVLFLAQGYAGDTGATAAQGLGTTALYLTSSNSVEYQTIATAQQAFAITGFNPGSAPTGNFVTYSAAVVLIKSNDAATPSAANHNVEFAPKDLPTTAYDAWTGFPILPSNSYAGLLYNRKAVAAPTVKPPLFVYQGAKPVRVEAEQDAARRSTWFYRQYASSAINGMDPVALPPKAVLYQEYTGFPRGPSPSQQLLFGRTTPTATVSQPWMAFTRSRLPVLEAEQDQSKHLSGNDIHLYRVGYQTVGQPWVAFTRPRLPIVEAEQDTAQRRTWFYNQQYLAINGTTALLGYQTNVLYEANTGFPRIPPPSQQILFGRTTPTPATPQPFYAFKWTAPPTVETEPYSVYRSPTNFFSFVQPLPINGMVPLLAYQSTVLYEANTGFPRIPPPSQQILYGRTTPVIVPQPFYAYKWAAPPTVEQEQYSPYRTPANYFSFVQPIPINGTLAYLAYQTNVLYEERSGFPRPPETDYTVMMFGRTTPVATNPWYVYAWQKNRPQDAESYEVRSARADALSFWRNTYTPPVANPWPYGQLHWQQAVTVEAEPYRVSTPFPYLSFYWKSPYVPPPYPGQTIWDATYEVVNDNMMVYPIEWIMSATVPYGYVISRTPFPDLGSTGLHLHPYGGFCRSSGSLGLCHRTQRHWLALL